MPLAAGQESAVGVEDAVPVEVVEDAVPVVFVEAETVEDVVAVADVVVLLVDTEHAEGPVFEGRAYMLR